MRNILILLILLSYAVSVKSAKSATMSFTGACHSNPIKTITIHEGKTVGATTIEELEKLGVQYNASEQGLFKLFGLNSSGVYELNTEDPSLGPNQMRVYGWCYEVNGVVLNYLPHQYTIQEDDQVNWFYGYVFYDSGNWGEMCQKASDLTPAFLCGE